ncbi:MAG: class I SAM-dependent methyltransferase [Candidatus Methanoperedens sp.]|nr:class I SAM-dependent methyltransferase [Candidatus Methanoperedens sp.]
MITQFLKNIKRRFERRYDFRYIILNLAEGRYNRFQNIFWDLNAEDIYEKWGKSYGDYDIISHLIDKYNPYSILDVGCGSGRLFKLYKEKKIVEVMGIDISKKALEIAGRDHPEIKTMRLKLEDVDLGDKRFDLVLSNRTLEHITKQKIDLVIQKLCSLSNLCYINELTDSDDENENKYLFKHNYKDIFGKYGFVIIEKGHHHKQTWFLFSHRNVSVTNFGSPHNVKFPNSTV